MVWSGGSEAVAAAAVGTLASSRLWLERAQAWRPFAMADPRPPRESFRRQRTWQEVLEEARRRRAAGRLQAIVHLLDLSGPRTGKVWPSLSDILGHFEIAWTVDLSGVQLKTAEPLIEALRATRIKRLRLGGTLLPADHMLKIVSAMREINEKKGPTWLEVGNENEHASILTQVGDKPGDCHPHSRWGCLCTVKSVVHVVERMRLQDSKAE